MTRCVMVTYDMVYDGCIAFIWGSMCKENISKLESLAIKGYRQSLSSHLATDVNHIELFFSYRFMNLYTTREQPANVKPSA